MESVTVSGDTGSRGGPHGERSGPLPQPTRARVVPRGPRHGERASRGGPGAGNQDVPARPSAAEGGCRTGGPRGCVPHRTLAAGQGSGSACGAATLCLCSGCEAIAETRGKETLSFLKKNKSSKIKHLNNAGGSHPHGLACAEGEMRSLGQLGALWRPRNRAEPGSGTGAAAGVGPKHSPEARQESTGGWWSRRGS